MTRVTGLILAACLFAFHTQGFSENFFDGYEAYVSDRCKKAFRIWYFDANQGDPVSAQALGLFELYGCPTDSDFNSIKDPDSGIEKIQNSSQPELLYELGLFFDRSGGGFQDQAQAIRFLEESYELGHGKAAIDLYRLTRESKWREPAVGAGGSIAKCDGALMSIEVHEEFENGVNALESCSESRKIDGLLRAVEILIRNNDPDRALEVLDMVPESVIGNLGEEVILVLALKEGLILEAKAEELFRLAQLERKLLQIEQKCDQAVRALHQIEFDYKQTFQELSPSLNKADLERSLDRVINAQGRMEAWCISRIDSMKFSIEKALAAVESGNYKHAWDTCEFFRTQDKYDTQCNYMQGVILFYGYGRSADKTWGKTRLETASRAGYTAATLELAHISIDVEKRLGDVRATRVTLEGLTRSVSATIEEKGYAFMLLGNLEKRIQDEKNFGTKSYYDVQKLYEKSRELNYWPVFVAMGLLYHENKRGALTVDRFEKALQMFRVAGDHDVKGAFPWLCEYYATGKWTSVNRNEADRWCNKSVEAGFSESRAFLN
jgi:TPR repeat protein